MEALVAKVMGRVPILPDAASKASTAANTAELAPRHGPPPPVQKRFLLSTVLSLETENRLAREEQCWSQRAADRRLAQLEAADSSSSSAQATPIVSDTGAMAAAATEREYWAAMKRGGHGSTAEARLPPATATATSASAGDRTDGRCSRSGSRDRRGRGRHGRSRSDSESGGHGSSEHRGTDSREKRSRHRSSRSTRDRSDTGKFAPSGAEPAAADPHGRSTRLHGDGRASKHERRRRSRSRSSSSSDSRSKSSSSDDSSRSRSRSRERSRHHRHRNSTRDRKRSRSGGHGHSHARDASGRRDR